MICIRCQEIYGEHVNIHDGHLCGGALNGKGGTCVGKLTEKKHYFFLNRFSKSQSVILAYISPVNRRFIVKNVIENRCFRESTSQKGRLHTKVNNSVILIGDSGGPLNCRINKNAPWVLAGITVYILHASLCILQIHNEFLFQSFGSGCSSKGYHPDVYIRISYYIKWIVKTISQN